MMNGQKIPANRVAAVVVWMIGAYATALGLNQMNMNPVLALLVGPFIQLVLTICERPMWRKRRYNIVAVIVVIVDIFFNYGGVWPFSQNLDKTGAWIGLTSSLGTADAAPAISKVVFTLMISIAIAAAPEWLWEESI